MPADNNYYIHSSLKGLIKKVKVKSDQKKGAY